MPKNFVGILVAVAVVVGGGSFYGGMVYGKSQVSAAAGARFAQRAGGTVGLGGQRGAGGRTGGQFTTGEIVSKDDKSITVSMPGAGSKIIFYSGTTQIGKAVAGTSADLTVGENVMVAGVANSDGSISAQTIQIRPAGVTSTPRGQ